MENAAFSDDGVHQVGVTCEADLGVKQHLGLGSVNLDSRSHHQTDTG